MTGMEFVDIDTSSGLIKITIIRIVAITPMIDYSQGNDWDMANIKNMDDFHKPAFDGIGFEDSMNEQRAYWTAEYSNGEKIS